MKKYKVIIADPPWKYDNPRAIIAKSELVHGFSGRRVVEHGQQVDVRKKYSTMSVEEISALTVPAADNCLLFLWVTNPFLADGSSAVVVRAWGFKPVTVLTWAKTKRAGFMTEPSMKVGRWFRSASEHIIFAKRGKVKVPVNLPAMPTWKSSLRLPHSVKPDFLYEWAELCCPEGPRLEMFARRKRSGWDHFGNVIPGGVKL